MKRSVRYWLPVWFAYAALFALVLAGSGCCSPCRRPPTDALGYSPPWVEHTYAPSGGVQGNHGLPGRSCNGMGPRAGHGCGAGACGEAP